MTHRYGIDINALERNVSTPRVRKTAWGSSSRVVSLPEYRLEKLTLTRGKTCRLKTPKRFEATLYLEAGTITVNDIPLESRETIAVPPQTTLRLSAERSAAIYIFEGPPEKERKIYFKKSETTDHREKYWGAIETIVGKCYAGKRMLVRKGASASLEYHCRKLESYYIHSGTLLLRLRAGRGEDRFCTLPAGSAVVMPPGLMHQRGGVEDTVIIEISTKDEDSDSFLVEDGQKHPMPRLAAVTGSNTRAEKGRICFDIDGILRTQTKGDYENAEPIEEGIRLVNALHKEGHRITLYTSSFMGRSGNDARAAYEAGYAFNKKQLDSWGIRYDELFMGKPPADIVVDDRAIFFKNDWREIGREIRKKLRAIQSIPRSPAENVRSNRRS